MSLFNLLKRNRKENSIPLTSMECEKTNIVFSTINSTHSKARFADGKVYWIANSGDMLIGYYENLKIYNATHNEIGSMSVNGDDIFVKLCAPNTVNCLYVNANASGYIEEVRGEYRNVAYLQNRSDHNTEDEIVGMAAAFVCLQADACDEQNEYSRLYANK